MKSQTLWTTFTIAILILGGASTRAASEPSLPKAFFHQILPSYNLQKQDGEFIGVAGKKIRYTAFHKTRPSSVLVVSPGQSEPAVKYAELVYDLRDEPVDIYVIDHRGQGRSERLLDGHEKSHVQNFQDYVDDLAIFAEKIVKPQTYPRSVLLGHSMGGAIATLFHHQHPKSFDRLVLSAPMFEIETGWIGEALALAVSQTLDFLSFGNAYAPGQRPFPIGRPFEKNLTTSSPARYEMIHQLLEKNPEIRIGGTTVRWVKESLLAGKKIEALTQPFQVPTLILQAEKDLIVRPERQATVCNNSPQFCILKKIPSARHDLLNEIDSVRDLVFKEIRESLNK